MEAEQQQETKRLQIVSREALRIILDEHGTVREADISDLDLTNDRFLSQNFTDVRFVGTDLRQTSLKGSLISRCVLHRVDFSHANLKEVSFHGSVLKDCIFTDTKL